jgi:hypothetical protein
MAHPMLEDDFSFTSCDLDDAVAKAVAAAGLPSVDRSGSSYREGGPAAYQIGYLTPHGEEVFIFDLAGMSLEKDALRFLLWSGLSDTDVLIYVAPSFTQSFMSELRRQRGDQPVHFLYIPEDSTGFEVFSDSMGAPDQPGDDNLDRLLAKQDRPEKPSSLEEARETVECYVTKTLERDMSPPEARVEATRVGAWLERFAREAGRADAEADRKA